MRICLPGHLANTFFIVAMVSGEAEGSNWLLLEDGVEVFSLASTGAVERAVWLSSADFFGQANRLSGRMCSKLFTIQKEKKSNKIKEIENNKSLINDLN